MAFFRFPSNNTNHAKMQHFRYEIFIGRHFLETIFLEIFQSHLSLWSKKVLSRVLVSKDVRRVPRRAASRSQVRLLSNANFPLIELVYRMNIWLEHRKFLKLQSNMIYESYKCNVMYHKSVYMNNVYNLISLGNMIIYTTLK